MLLKFAGVSAGLKKFRVEIIENYQETVKLSVPAVLYALQNNLLYTALTYLDSVTYQVIDNFTQTIFKITFLLELITFLALI